MRAGAGAIHCPTCGRRNDRHERTVSGGAPDVPEAGDVSICWGCGAPAIYTHAGTRLRRATPAELAELQEDDEVRRVQAVIAMYGLQR